MQRHALIFLATIRNCGDAYHDGNIRCLEPVAPFANHHDYGSGEDKEAQNKEEPLGIVTEVTAIIFLVAFLNLPAFLDKHGIDLTDILLHLAIHLCSRSNRYCIFCQLASAKFTETFNLSVSVSAIAYCS